MEHCGPVRPGPRICRVPAAQAAHVPKEALPAGREGLVRAGKATGGDGVRGRGGRLRLTALSFALAARNDPCEAFICECDRRAAECFAEAPYNQQYKALDTARYCQ